MSNEILENGNGVDVRELISEIVIKEHEKVLQAETEDEGEKALKNEQAMIKLLLEVNKSENEAIEADIRLSNEKEISEKKLALEAEKLEVERERLAHEKAKFDRECEVEDKKMDLAERQQTLDEKRLENEIVAEKNRAIASKLQAALMLGNLVANVFGLKSSKDICMGTLALNFSDNCMKDRDAFNVAKKSMDDVLRRIGFK